MPDCEHMAERISAHIDGALAPEEEALLAGHLAQCGACRDLLADLEEIHAAMGDLAAEEAVPPDSLCSGVMAQIRSVQVLPLTPPKKGRSPWRSWAALAAVFAVVLLGVSTHPLWSNAPVSGGAGQAEPRSAAVPEEAEGGALPAGGAAAPPPQIRVDKETAAEEDGGVADTARPPAPTPAPRETDPPAPAEHAASGQAESAPPSPVQPPASFWRRAYLTDSPTYSPDPGAEAQPPAPSPATQAFAAGGGGAPAGGEAGDSGDPDQAAVYCGILTLPYEQAGALEGVPFTQADGQRSYILPADAFEALAADLEGAQDVSLARSGAQIDAQAPQGLVLVTGVPQDTP